MFVDVVGLFFGVYDLFVIGDGDGVGVEGDVGSFYFGGDLFLVGVLVVLGVFH